jgi:hypothetical protein
VIPSLIATSIWACAILGLGSLLRIEAPPELRTATSGFAGLLVMAVIGLWTNVAVPISTSVSLVVLAVGLLVFGSSWRRVLPATPMATVALACVLVGLAALTQFPGRHGDQGLYYLQAVQWAKASAPPLGLARLHGRLGFNSSWFLVAAVVETPLLVGRSAFVIDALPILFGTAAVSGAVGSIRRGDRSLETIFLGAMLVPLCFAVRGVASVGPDAPVAIVVYFSVALWMRAMARREDVGWCAFSASAFSVLGLTMKLSALPLAIGSGVLIVLSRPTLARRSIVALAGIAAAMLVPWAGRGIILSGCLLYPASRSCFASLPWGVSVSDAGLMQDWIMSWARMPGFEPAEVLGNWRWVCPWLARAGTDPAAVGAAAFLSGGVLAGARDWRSAGKGFWTAFVLSLGGALFWLYSAPDPRFSQGFLFALGLVPLSLAISRRFEASDSEARARLRLRLCVLTVVGGLLVFLAANDWMAELRHPGNFALVEWPQFPQAVLSRRVTVSGAVVNVPVGTDQCWLAPLPCAPDGTPGLSLRGPFELVRESP